MQAGKAGGVSPIKKFPDKPTSLKSYGTGTEQERAVIEWMRRHTNSYGIIDKTDADQREDFILWTRGWFMHGQQYHGWDNMTPEEKRETQTYDDCLDTAVVHEEEGLEVVRLASAELLGFTRDEMPTLGGIAARKKRFVTSAGNMSAAAASEGLVIAVAHCTKTVEYHFRIPGGTKGAGMWIGDARVSHWGAEQREFMLNRDTVWEIGRAREDSTRGVFIVEMLWVGRLPHDYGRSGRV